MTMTLHGFAPSSHAHRAALVASPIGAAVEVVETELGGGAHKRPELLALTPSGKAPALVDGDAVVPESDAILVCLAKKLGGTDWPPEDPAGAAEVQRWPSVAAGPIAFGPAAARFVAGFGAKLNAAEAIVAHVEKRLTGRDRRAADRPAAADVALRSCVAGAPERSVDLAPFPAVRAWVGRVVVLPGFPPIRRTRVGLETMEEAR